MNEDPPISSPDNLDENTTGEAKPPYIPAVASYHTDDEAFDPPERSFQLNEHHEYGDDRALPVSHEPEIQSGAGGVLAAVREVVETIVLAVVIFLGVRAVVQNFRVEGSSMFPSFVDGQYVLVNRAVYTQLDLQGLTDALPILSFAGADHPYIFHAPRRGDVVIFHPPPPEDPSRDFIKRVIGVPGDTVNVCQAPSCRGQVYVNGQSISETFINQPTFPANPRFSQVTLGADQFYVMGDNRGNSSDSRSWGPIKGDELIGRAWLIYWPASDWRLAPNHAIAAPPAALLRLLPHAAMAAATRLSRHGTSP